MELEKVLPCVAFIHETTMGNLGFEPQDFRDALERAGWKGYTFGNAQTEDGFPMIAVKTLAGDGGGVRTIGYLHPNHAGVVDESEQEFIAVMEMWLAARVHSQLSTQGSPEVVDIRALAKRHGTLIAFMLQHWNAQVVDDAALPGLDADAVVISRIKVDGFRLRGPSHAAPDANTLARGRM